jgi:DNA-binding response OmpR family regulator
MVRILVTEGDPAVATFISRALRSKGWLVDIADIGSTTVELMRSGRYRLVVLDLSQAHDEGMGVLCQLIEGEPRPKVIVLTGAAGAETGVRALELDAADYLGKPFNVNELLARVSARLLETPRARSGHYLHCNGVTLDLARRKVDTGNGEISLTEREFVLLAH